MLSQLFAPIRERVLNPLRDWFVPTSPVADATNPSLAIAASDLVYHPSPVPGQRSVFDSYYFQLAEEENGKTYTGHKVVKLLALDFVPLEAREQLAILDKMRMGLRGLYNAEVDFVYLVAGMFQPTFLGVTQCYGVIGYDEVSREAADAKAERALGALRAVMANFEQSRLKNLTLDEVEWIRQAFAEMCFGLIGLGHPDPSRVGQTLAQLGGKPGQAPDEYTLEQNEMLYRGMALLGEEFLNVVMAYRVTPQHILALQARTAREASRWASMERGVKSINVGLGVPLILSGAFGQMVGTNFGQAQHATVTNTHGQTLTHQQGVSLGHTITHGQAHTDGVTDTTSVVTHHSLGHTVGSADGKSHTDSKAHTDSTAHTVGTATTDGSSSTSGVSTSESSGWSSSSPNGVSLPVVGNLGGLLSGVAGGSVHIGGNAQPELGGSQLGGGQGGATLNFSTGSHSESGGTSTSHFSSSSSMHSVTHSVADTVGRADTKGTADTRSHTDNQSQSVTDGVSIGSSHAVSHSDTVSQSEGDTVGVQESAAQANSQSQAVGRGTSVSEGRTLAETNGLGVSAGLAPNISVGKSYQWEDHNATLVANLLRGQEELLEEAAVEGGFITDNYYFCRTERGRQALAALFAQAFQGTKAVTPAQTRQMKEDEFEYLRNCAMTFTPSTRREMTPGLLQTYRDAEFLPPLRLAAYTAVGLIEAGRAVTVQERIPPFAFNPQLQGEVVVGYQVMFETGETTAARCRLSRDKMAHIGIFADTGAGKSVLATWLEYQIATQWDYRVVILDFGRGHRALMNIIPPERFNLYGLDESSPRPIRWNPLQIGRRISPQTQLDQTCQIIAAAGRMGQRQYGFMWDALRQLYLERGVLTFDREVQNPEVFSKQVRDHPNDPLSVQRIALAKVQENERLILDAARAAQGETPLPTGDVFLRDLPREDLQLLAVERSKQVDISLWYDRLEQIQSTKKSGMPDHTALEGVLHRLRPFRYGALANMYGLGEGSIAIEELAYPFGVAVLEGGTLAEAQKAMILGLAAFHIYENSIQQRRETMETEEQQEKHPMLLVLEEAHKIIGGVAENASSDANAQTGGAIISAPLWGTLARDGRKYNISYMLIGQSPSQFPEEMVTNCNIYGVGTLKGDKDRKMMLSALARSTMGFEDNPYMRFLSRIERARMIWKTAIAMDRKQVEPILIETIQLPVREPSDSEVQAHFKLWGPLLENLKKNGNGNGSGMRHA